MQRGGSLSGAKSWKSARLGLLGLLLGAAAACGGKKGPEAESPVDMRIHRSTEVALEKCDTEGAEAFDADGDGKAEVQVVKKGARDVCQTADLDADGRLDRVTYYDGDGRVRRIESDFDRDGRIDEVTLLEGGVVREKHRATTLSGKLDTWEFYKDARLEHTERDKNGDGIIDQWWEYPSPSCPLIHTDGDGDGRPDPATTIDYCKVTGYVPPEEVKARPPTTSLDFESSAPPGGGEVREISNVSETEAKKAPPTPAAPPTPPAPPDTEPPQP